MSFKTKYSAEKKEDIILGYLNGIYGFNETARINNISKSTLSNWIRLYKTLGLSGLKAGNKTTPYSSVIKNNAVLDYLSGEFTMQKVLEKYGIRSDTQLKRWILKYNSHEELKTSGNGGVAIMTKGRKTTYDERLEIVRFCIENNINYAETAEKYSVSYQQVYGWVKKYNQKGIEGLIDKRGKRKPVEELTEIEKLRAENKLLKAEKKRVELENIFLKKLDEIERGRF